MLQKEIHEWQIKTFPESHSLSKISHLKEEIKEVEHELKNGSNKEHLALELADCTLLLFGIAGLNDIDLLQAVKKKLAINKTRNWTEPDKNGVYYHK